MEIIIKNFTPHYNSALGKVITNERQYKEEIKRGGYIPYEEAQERTAALKESRKNVAPSEKAVNWMRDVRSSADAKGNVKLSDRQIEVLKETGAVTNRSNPAWEEAVKKHEGRCYSS